MVTLDGLTVTRYDSQLRAVWSHTFNSVVLAQRAYALKCAQVW